MKMRRIAFVCFVAFFSMADISYRYSPSPQRQVSPPIDATPGTISWTFPDSFTNDPTCFESLVTSRPDFSFDAPLVVMISKTAVTVKISAHPSSLTLTSIAVPLALPLTLNPPSGTTVTLTCSAPLP